jgi:hypothetical protein
MKRKPVSLELTTYEWARMLDASGRSGISRPELWRAVVRGDILGSHLVKPGCKKGIWLINLRSLDDYIRSFLPGGSRNAQTAEVTK